MVTQLSAAFFENIGKIFSSGAFMVMILKGLKTTLIVSVGAAVLGLILGTITAIIKIQPKNKWTVVPKAVCSVYTTVIRGTPMALQLFITAFVIFAIRGFPQEVTAVIVLTAARMFPKISAQAYFQLTKVRRKRRALWGFQARTPLHG